MNVVFIADDGPVNTWLIREVERAHDIALIIRPDWSVPRPEAHAAPARRSRVSPVEKAARVLRHAWFSRHDRDATERLTQALSLRGNGAEPQAPVRAVPAWDMNGATTEALLREATPDLVVVSGAPMLKPNIYRLARGLTVNLHFGISPAYRGMHTLLVPWQRRDFQNIGATLHVIDDGIDTGPVLFRVYPALSPDDDLVTIEAKIVQLAAGALGELCTAMRRSSSLRLRAPSTEAGSGTLVRFHDRTIAADLAHRLRRLAGNRPPRTTARIECFYDA